jgi:hypothetical protein
MEAICPDRSIALTREVRTHAVNPHELLVACRRRAAPDAGIRVETGYRLNEALNRQPCGCCGEGCRERRPERLRAWGMR